MKKIENEELKQINAGAIKWGIIGIVSGIVTFIIGAFDGFTNPIKCRG